MRTQKTNTFGQNREVLDGMAAVAGKFKNWRHASEVLTEVKAVPTVFCQYDVATRVMGHPIARFTRLHGPSNEGKTTFSLGMMLSFLMKAHFVGFADAERTTPADWVSTMMGEYAKHPGFTALPVTSYEATVDAVREFCEAIAKARDNGVVSEETTGLIVIDSIRKLVPKNLMKELLKSGADSKKGVDGMGGRAGQVKAALNAAWVDELVPLLADTGISMIVLARETDDPDAGMFDKQYKVGGGNALFYDASLDLRVQRSFVYDEADKKIIYGEKHRIEVHKTKVGEKDERIPFGNFYTSNGVLCPAGFDRPRDVLELAKDQGVVACTTNGFYSYEGAKLGHGVNKALEVLRANQDLCAEIELKARNTAAASWVA